MEVEISLACPTKSLNSLTLSFSLLNLIYTWENHISFHLSSVCLFQGDGVGDSCSSDYDGDRIPDTEDACPNNNQITKADFRGLQIVALDPYGDSQVDPVWKINNEVHTAVILVVLCSLVHRLVLKR